MSVLHELTNEQIAAFKDCKTREEMIAKANELGIKYTEEDIEAGFKVLHPAEAEASGELDDDALDAVAGGTTYNKKGYAVVTMNVKCLAPGQPYAKSPFPAHPHTMDGKRCGTCIHMVTMDGMEVCPLTIDPAIANRK